VIIDSPSIIQLALGTDRRVPEQGDAQVVLPSTLVPTVELMQTTREVPNAGIAMLESACRDNGQRTNNNQAASADTLITLPPGRYRLECFLMAIGNVVQTFTAADVGVRITIDFGNTSTTLLGAFIGAGMPQHAYGSFEVLMPVQFTLVHRVMITPVGQTIISRCTVNAVRIL